MDAAADAMVELSAGAVVAVAEAEVECCFAATLELTLRGQTYSLYHQSCCHA